MSSNTAIVKTAARLCYSIYAYPDSPLTAWDLYREDQVCWGVTKVDDLWYLVFRGSVTALDWERDFEALAVYDPVLDAHVHPGFARDIQGIVQQAVDFIGGQPMAITGHSLGAARSAIAAAHAIKAGTPPIARVAFGEPRPGFMDLAQLISQVPNYNFVNCDANGYDRVTGVPFTLPEEWYVAGSPQIDVTASPAADDEWGPLFSYHHIQLYYAAIQKLGDDHADQKAPQKAAPLLRTQLSVQGHA